MQPHESKQSSEAARSRPGPSAAPGDQLMKTLYARLDGMRAEYKEVVAARVAEFKTVEVRREVVPPGGQAEAETTIRRLQTHAKDIDRDTRRVIKAVKEGVGEGYLRHRTDLATEVANLLDVRIEVAALLSAEGVVAEVDVAATKFVKDHLAREPLNNPSYAGLN